MELIRNHEKLGSSDEVGRKAFKLKMTRAEDIVWTHIAEGDKIGTSGSNAKDIYSDRLNQKKSKKEEIAKPLADK